jgi:hypothetical protein
VFGSRNRSGFIDWQCIDNRWRQTIAAQRTLLVGATHPDPARWPRH